MNRALVLLPMVALASGCYVAPPCDPVANVYWTFNVPGAANLSCGQAGVDTVDVFVDGALIDTVSCVGPGGVEGIQLVGFGHGTHLLQLDVYSGGVAGTRRYQLDQNIAFNGCTSNYDAPAVGLPGRLQFQYSFADGGNLCGAASSFLWFQVTSNGAVYDVVDEQNSPSSLACTNLAGGRNVDVLTSTGGTSIPAGVYTRTRFEEVAPALGGGFGVLRANCVQDTFVHAGDLAIPVTLASATQLCP